MNGPTASPAQKLRIAVLSPVAWRTPPRHYGPWEQMAWNTAEGLVALGHAVTLFATKDSSTSGELAYCCDTGWEEDRNIDAKVAECLHISNVMEHANEFDIIHNHFDFHPLTYSRLIDTPMVTTIHGFSSQKIVPVYKKYERTSAYISISDADRHPDLSYAATVYNGIRTEQFPFQGTPEDYLLFFGRIHPDKGTREAIEISKRSGKKLLIAGIVQDQGYFERHVAPFIDNDTVRFLGPVGPGERPDLLGKAAALLHPIDFAEPFGLSVVEAMCCGTPVIAFRKGSMPELILDGRTGFLVDDTDAATARVRDVPHLNRKECRAHVQRSFSSEQMVRGYLAVYEKLLGLAKE